MRVGLILAGVPKYSETFFRNKISHLQKADGYHVVLFADRYSPVVEWTLCKVVYAVQLNDRWLPASLQIAACFVRTLLIHPAKSLRLLLLNRKTGLSWMTNIRSVIRASHLFGQPLDWLHFGFGTMAVGRENVARVIGAKMAVSFRGFDHYIFPLKNPGCYKTLYKQADKIHVLSQSMMADLVDQGVPASRIQVIRPAIDLLEFALEEPRRAVANCVRIVTTARLHWIKGLEYTLDAMRLLRNMGINFHYTVIGDGPERERLIFARHQLGLTELVTFSGKMSQSEVAKTLRQTDIYLQYSIQEGFCNAVIEAQAMGLLCVVSDAEGLRENVLHGKTGWIVPKRKPSALAKKIFEILHMDDLVLTAIRKDASARARTDFGLRYQTNSFIAFYEN